MALIPLSEALSRILATIESEPELEVVSLGKAAQRYCAEALSATIAVPPADNSAMDGYAVASRDVPGTLPISQRLPAGQAPSPLEKGTAARIFTGAEIPEGADAVILQEDVEVEEGLATLPAVKLGQNIRRRGDDILPGDELVAVGHRLGAQDIGLLASVGFDALPVFRPLTIAVLTTGDELREPGSGDLKAGQIYNSNRFSLIAQIKALGMTVVDIGNLPDDPDQIGEALEYAASVAECVITAGGVSVGEEDHVKSQIEKRGCLDLWKLAIKPGKPLAFGHVCGTPIFGLPGNPVSAFITFALVAKPWLIRRQGGLGQTVKRFPVRAAFSQPCRSSREEFLRVQLVGSGEAMRAHLTGSQSSGVMKSLSEADALAVIAPGKAVAEDDWLEVMPLSTL